MMTFTLLQTKGILKEGLYGGEGTPLGPFHQKA